MKKHAIRWLLFALVLAVVTICAAATVFAVPAKPGSAYDGAQTCPSATGETVKLSDIPVRRYGRRAPAKGEPQRTIPLVTVVVGLKNDAYSDDYDWNATLFSGEKSLQAYYSDMSFGQFTFVPAAETSAFGKAGNTNKADRAGDGVIHVKLKLNHKDWSLQTLFNNDLAKTFIQAINEAGKYINFASYDADGNGRIDKTELALGFVVAGCEAAAIEDPSGVDLRHYLWSHASSIDDMIDTYKLITLSTPAPGGVKVSDYIAISEQMTPGEQEPISVFAHELGHYLGLPDLYDTTYSEDGAWVNYEVSDLSLMANGSWGADPDGGYIPSSMDVFCRCKLGWYTPVTAKTGTYTVNAQSYAADEAFSAVKIPTQRAWEYYLVENRQFTKWDAGLADVFGLEKGGLIFWHVDEQTYEKYEKDNMVNNAFHNPAVMPLYIEGSAEEGADREVAILGETVYNGEVFFDAAYWAMLSDDLGEKLDLPLYGKDGAKDDPAARFFSGLTVSFPDDSAAAMRIDVDLDHHNHVTRLIPGVPVGCREDGVADTWLCDACSQLFLDEAATQPVDEAPIIVCTGHADADHNGNCTRCGEHIAEPYCRYCGKTHKGSSAWLVKFFHEIAYFFAHLFGKM